MLPQEIIRKKRDDETLTKLEIAFFVKGLTNGSLTEGQIAAFAMAVYFQGMSMEERIILTQEMMHSGTVLGWDDLDLDGPVVDKHSTGGVGDKVSLMLAPIVAACGLYVPMISGRGLGHSGGTLDKLESIPGYNTQPDIDLFRSTISKVGCGIIGQTGDLAPADKLLYSVRDVTATIESVPLITASILSKKLAAGLDGLVMDIKTGNGAFAKDFDFAREVAGSIIHVAQNFDVKTSALITDMNQPLGKSVGNALEVKEVADYLTGNSREERLHELVIALAAEMLVIGGLADSAENGAEKAREVLKNGNAAETFSRMVAGFGGPKNLLENYESHLSKAPVQKLVNSSKSGYVTGINTRAVGLAVVELGGGRVKSSDSIDSRVGFTDVVGLNEKIEVGEPLALVHAQSDDDAVGAQNAILKAFEISESANQPGPIVLDRITYE